MDGQQQLGASAVGVGRVDWLLRCVEALRIMDVELRQAVEVVERVSRLRAAVASDLDRYLYEEQFPDVLGE